MDTHPALEALDLRFCFGCGKHFQPSRRDQWSCTARCRNKAAAWRRRVVRELEAELSQALIGLHQQVEGEAQCAYCGYAWPCPERKILEEYLEHPKR